MRLKRRAAVRWIFAKYCLFTVVNVLPCGHGIVPVVLAKSYVKCSKGMHRNNHELCKPACFCCCCCFP